MAGRYYTNTRTFLPGTRAKGTEVDDELDSISSGFDTLEIDVDRSIKLSSAPSDQVITESVSARQGRYLVFDSSGNISLSSGTGADSGLRADLASVSTGYGASLVGVEDSAGNFAGATVEAVLAEIISTLASTAIGKGASTVGVEDSAANFTGTTVEAVLAEIIATLASTATGKGASTVGVEDSAGNFAGTTVETALAEAGAIITNAVIAALAGLTSAADKLPYFTGPGSASTTNLTAFARTLLDDANAAAARATLGAAGLTDSNTFSTGTNNFTSAVQAGGTQVSDGTAGNWNSSHLGGQPASSYARKDLTTAEVFAGGVDTVNYSAGGFGLRVRQDGAGLAILQWTNASASVQMGAAYADSANDIYIVTSVSGGDINMNTAGAGIVKINSNEAWHAGGGNSGPTAVSGYTQVGPGIYRKDSIGSVTALTYSSLTSFAVPSGSNARAVILEVTAKATSASGSSVVYAGVQIYSDSGGTNIAGTNYAQAYDDGSTSGTILSYTTQEMIAPVISGNVYIKFDTRDAGGNGSAHYRIVGYID